MPPPDLSKPPAEFPAPTEEEQQIQPETLAKLQQRVAQFPRRPLPSPDEAPTDADRRQQVLAWALQAYVEGYKKVGKKDPAWDETALEFLEAFAYTFASVPDGKTLSDVVALGQAAIEAGCDDPMVTYAYGNLRFVEGPTEDRQLAWRHASKAAKQLEGAGYDSFVGYQAHAVCADLATERSQQTAEVHLQAAVRLAAKSAAEPMLPGQQRIMLKFLARHLKSFLQTKRAELLAALANPPSADPWIYNILAAEEHIRLGWEVRGDSLARDVPPEAWPVFRARLEAARLLLLEAWQLHPEFPEAATRMITVVTAIGPIAGDDNRFWFDEAVRGQFDFQEAYSKLTWSQSPRWGGSHRQMLLFGRECLSTRRFETNVPRHFHEAVFNVACELVEPRRLYGMRGIYEDYRTLVEGISAAPDSEPNRARYQSMLACVAWMAGRDDEARQIAEELGDTLDPTAFESFKASIGEFRQALRITLPARDDGKFPRLAAGIQAADLSPDGATLWLGSSDGTIQHWDTASGQKLAEFAPHAKDVTGLVLSADGRLFASGSQDGTLRVGDVGDPTKARLLSHTVPVPVSALALSRDGTTLAAASTAGGMGTMLGVWDSSTGESVSNRSISRRRTLSLDFSPDGRRLAAVLVPMRFDPDCPGGELVVWDMDSDTENHRSQPFTGKVTAVAFSDDGQTLAVAGSQREAGQFGAYLRPIVQLWDTNGFTPRGDLSGDTSGEITWLRFFPDNKVLACASKSGSIRLWDTTSGRTLAVLQGHAGELTSLAVDAAADLLATTDGYGRIKLWDLATPPMRSRVQADVAAFAFEGGVKELCFADGGLLAVTAQQTGLSLWDPRDEFLSARSFPTPPLTEAIDADVSPDGKTVGLVLRDSPVTGKDTSEIVLWDVAASSSQTALAHDGQPTCLRFSADGKHIAAGYSSSAVVLYNAQTRQPWPWGIQTEHRTPPGRLAFSPNGGRLASGTSDGTVKVWKLPQNPQQQQKTLSSEHTLKVSSTVHCLAFSPDGEKLLIGYGSIELWDLALGRKLMLAPGQEAAFSPDGATFATAGGSLKQQVIVRDTATGQERARWTVGTEGDIWTVDFTPSGQQLLVGDSSGRLRCYSIETGETVPDFSEPGPAGL